MDYKQFLDRDGLESFNHILNERYQGRFKYMGEFELNNDFTDFNVLVPAHVGDVYQAKTGEVDEITFGEMTIKDGDWFVVLNESRFDVDDPTVIKTHANDPEADWAVGNVEIAKLGSQMDDLVGYGYYDALKPIAPYAYEAHYDGLNYPYAYKNFDDVVAATGGCSAVRVGNKFGRNLDWIYNEQVDFVVHTSAKGGRYATLGLCGQIDKLDKDFVASKEYATEYILLPFYCVDGINEKHVFVSMNVMPDDPTTPNEIEPDGEIYASICANMIPRYILDHCATADEAIDCIQHHLKIHFSDRARAGGFLPHYLIGDTDKTYVVEYVGGNIVATLANNSSAVMTNFRIAGTTPNADGKYNTPDNKASGLPSVVNGLDAHAAGVERFNLAKTEIGMGTSTSLLMEKLHYTNTYKSPTPFWYSEYVGLSGTTIDSDAADFATAIGAAITAYNARSRDPEDANYGTWQSKHTCVYDIDTLKLSASFQEEAGAYEFEIAEEDALPDGVNDGDALIYVGGKWQIMPQYGYIDESENSYDEDITMFLDAEGLYRTNIADELVFIEGESYTVKVGDIAEETAVAVRSGDLPDPDDLIDPNEIIFKGEHITIAKRLGGVSTVLTMDNGTLDPVHLSLVGKLQGDYHTIDPRYIEKIIEEVDELPIDDIEENKIYKTHTPWNVDSVYILSDAAVEAGWTADAYGIHSTDLELDWDTVNEDWENQQTLFTAYAAGNIYRFRLSGGEEYSIMFKAEDAVEPPKHDDRISLWVFDNESSAYKEIYNSDTSVVGGINNYNNLTNKPRINNNTLTGSQTSTGLEIAVSLTQAQYDGLAEAGVLNPETLYCITDGVATTDTKDYEELTNRPSLEGVILREGLSYNDLGLMGRSEIESKLSSFLTFKGTVNAVADLPTDATQGDVYFVGELQRNYAFNGLVWNDMGGSVDMSIYQKRQGDTLTTTNKSIEGGINELDGRIGKTAMTTTATNVTAAINELDNDKLDVEPGGLNTTATKVVDAINEINSLIDMYEIVVAGGSGSLDDVDYTKISQHPAHCYIRRGGEIYQYAYTNSGQFMYHANRPDLTRVVEAWIVIGSDQSWNLYTLWDDSSKFTRPDTKYVTINTEQTLNDYIAQMPNNSIKDGYSTPWGMTEPGWTTIHKYNNNFVKIIHWTRREGLAYVRSKDNSTTWSDWYKINMAKTTEQKAGMMGNFLEIKNSSYEFHTYGGTIQLNHQRDCLGFMCGNNMDISVINNPSNISYTRPTPPTGWTGCVQFTSAGGTCKVLWDNSRHRMGYTEEGCSMFGRHVIVCAERT